MKTKIYQTETRPYRPNTKTPQLPIGSKHNMIYTIVSVKDRALNAYGRPIFVHTQGQAIRSFQDELNRNNEQNEMYKHPEDYDLYLVGTFDDSTGLFKNNETLKGGLLVEDPPKQIAIGKQMKITKD